MGWHLISGSVRGAGIERLNQNQNGLGGEQVVLMSIPTQTNSNLIAFRAPVVSGFHCMLHLEQTRIRRPPLDLYMPR